MREVQGLAWGPFRDPCPWLAFPSLPRPIHTLQDTCHSHRLCSQSQVPDRPCPGEGVGDGSAQKQPQGGPGPAKRAL